MLVICLYCCSCHLRFYDRGRLGRVEIATLRVGAKEKEGMGEGGKKYTRTISSFCWETPTHWQRELLIGVAQGKKIDACQSNGSLYCLFWFCWRATAGKNGSEFRNSGEEIRILTLLLKKAF